MTHCIATFEEQDCYTSLFLQDSVHLLHSITAKKQNDRRAVMSQRNSARRIQQPGSKCSNPKPSPHKKPNRAPGEGRFRTENEPRYWDRWFAWNHRRKPKLPDRDSPPSRDCIAEAYEKIPARVYRHNLAIVDKVGKIGQTWHTWREAGLMDPT
jgi:hypothetical protein